MTTAEFLQLKKELLVKYQKDARRYNKLAESYLKNYTRQIQLCDDLIRDIDDLKNKLELENTQ